MPRGSSPPPGRSARSTDFAIASRSEAIGGIGFHPQADVHRLTAEIGYWLGEPFWGRGIATQALRELSD